MVKLRLGAARAFPAGLALKLKKALEEEKRFPAFPLIDPLKRFAAQDFGWAQEWPKDWSTEQSVPRISVPGVFDPVFPEAIPVPNRDDPIDTASLLRRIRSLKARARQSAPPCQAIGPLEGQDEMAQKPGMPGPAACRPSAPALRRENI